MFFFAVSFASLGFISLYMAGKLGVFNEKGRGQSLRLLVSLLPLLIALTVALSRTCDYHHHWQGIDKQKTRPHFVLLFFFLTKFFFFSFPGKKRCPLRLLIGIFRRLLLLSTTLSFSRFTWCWRPSSSVIQCHIGHFQHFQCTAI